MLCLIHSVMSDSLSLHGLYPARLLCPWGFSKQEHWSGLPYPSPGNLPNPGIKPRSPTLQEDSLAAEPQEKPKSVVGSGFFHTYQITRTCSLETTMPLLYLYFLKVKSNENKWPQISFSPFTSKASVVIKFPGILRCTF